ncbi:unnamed protein product [Anisakis simplex]|uniref:Uncharacterized protein n=1 Tax=Anisakis simplex TaxID=6269 RepID=A0A0M3J3V1_ANISI|nr:unnamed protein product [Anisakis simplex]
MEHDDRNGDTNELRAGLSLSAGRNGSLPRSAAAYPDGSAILPARSARNGSAHRNECKKAIRFKTDDTTTTNMTIEFN